jgi:hypothetical protein
MKRLQRLSAIGVFVVMSVNVTSQLEGQRP